MTGFVIVDYYGRFLNRWHGFVPQIERATVLSPEFALMQIRWQVYRGNCVWALRVR